MLAARIPTEFPYAGSFAWLRPEPGREGVLQVRIIQHAVDGLVRVSAVERPPFGQQASADRRVALAELAATQAEALTPARKPRRKTKRTK